MRRSASKVSYPGSGLLALFLRVYSRNHSHIEDVVDGYWTKIGLALCAACDESLRLCDGHAWEWFCKYTPKNSDQITTNRQRRLTIW